MKSNTKLSNDYKFGFTGEKKKIGINPAAVVLIVAITAAVIRFGFPVMKKNYEKYRKGRIKTTPPW